MSGARIIGVVTALLLAAACDDEVTDTPGTGVTGDLCEDVVCAALSPCHDVGTCDPDTGECSNPEKRTGAVCDDGDACTYGDHCDAGACVPAGDVVCRPIDGCHVAGTCDPASGCSNPVADDGTSCGDNNACTTDDHCVAGVCTGTAVTCSAVDACHVAGVCNPGTGRCTTPARPDGSPCDTGVSNQCIVGACDDGECVATPVVCKPIDDCHEAGVCNPSTGECSTPNRADGSPCEDGNLCTENDNCQGGSCVTGTPVSCQPTDQCHDAGVCDPATGCSNPRKTDGSLCEDGNLCTQVDVCVAGSCVGGDRVRCTPQDQCHVTGVCNPQTGLCSNPPIENGVLCDDGNPCTVNTTCQVGDCTDGEAVVCTPLDQCHVAGTCDPSTGCSNPPAQDGTNCDDGDLCTLVDTCDQGICTAGAPVQCQPLGQCYDAGVCNPDTGECTNPHKTNGTLCDDSNLCTQVDTCQSGTCYGSDPVICEEQECLDMSCVPATGACEGTPVADATTCDDGDPCSPTSECTGGVCLPSSSVTCTALDGCHEVGFCDPASGVCTEPTLYGGNVCDSLCFTEATDTAGIDWLNQSGTTSLIGANAVLLYYDDDDLLDLLLVGEGGGVALYRNLGDLDFEDQTVDSGLEPALPTDVAMNAAVGDYDNDGDTDIYLVNRLSNRLYENNGDGTFTDVTSAAGLTNDVWSSSAAFGDFDRDGYLDLIVGNYIGSCCPATDLPNELWHNDGDGTFTDVTGDYGVAGTGVTTAVLWSDYDADGWLDLFICNNLGEASHVFHNNGANASGAGDFFDSGTAAPGIDAASYCQGLAVGDWDGDADLDYYVANVGANLLLTNAGTFTDSAATEGAAVGSDGCPPNEDVSSWGVGFVDVDNDCNLDLYVVNGSMTQTGIPTNADYPPNVLLQHQGSGTTPAYVDMAMESGLGDPRIGRGTALGDLDGDGDVDAVLMNLEGSPVLYRNDSDPVGGWLEIETRGRLSNADGYGTRVTLDAGSCVAAGEVSGAQLHFGLGAATEVSSLELTWLSTVVQQLVHIPPDTAVPVVEPLVTVASASGPGAVVSEGSNIVVDLGLANHDSADVGVDVVVDVWIGGASDGWGSSAVATTVAVSGSSLQVSFAVPNGSAHGSTTDVELVVTVSDAGGGVDQHVIAAQIGP